MGEASDLTRVEGERETEASCRAVRRAETGRKRECAVNFGEESDTVTGRQGDAGKIAGDVESVRATGSIGVGNFRRACLRIGR